MIGKHLLADFYGVSPERLDAPAVLSDCLRDGARRCGMTPVAEPVLHHFDGGGLTGFLLLAESHIAFHTFPERGYIAIDIFSCGRSDPRVALDVFREALCPGRERVTVSPRGEQAGHAGDAAAAKEACR